MHVGKMGNNWLGRRKQKRMSLVNHKVNMSQQYDAIAKKGKSHYGCINGNAICKI